MWLCRVLFPGRCVALSVRSGRWWARLMSDTPTSRSPDAAQGGRRAFGLDGVSRLLPDAFQGVAGKFGYTFPKAKRSQDLMAPL